MALPSWMTFWLGKRAPDIGASQQQFYPAAISPQLIRPEQDQIIAEAFQPPYTGPGGLDDYGRETDTMREMYREYHRKEPAARSALEGLAAAIADSDVTVQPDDEDHDDDKRAAEFIQWTVDRSANGWDGLIRNTLLPGLIDGWSVGEPVFAGTTGTRKWGGLWGVDHVKSKDTANLRLRLDVYRNVLGVVNLRRGVASYPDEKVILFTHADVFDNPFGASEMRAAYRGCQLIDMAWKLWAYAAKAYGGPFLKATVKDEKRRQIMAKALADARANGYIVCPDGDVVELLNFSVAVNFQTFKDMIETAQKEIYMTIRGGFAQFYPGSTGGGEQRGSASVSKGAGSDPRERLLCKAVGRVLSRQLLPSILGPNFGAQIGRPKIILGGTAWDETKSQLDVGKSMLNDFKQPLSKKQLYAVSQWSAPTSEEDTVHPPQDPSQAGFPGQPGGGGFPGGGSPGPVGGQPGGPAGGPGGDGGPGGPGAPGGGSVPPELIAAMYQAKLQGNDQALADLTKMGQDPAGMQDMLDDGQSAQFSASVHFGSNGWTPGTSKSGKVMAIKAGSRPKYGKEAEAVLAAAQRGDTADEPASAPKAVKPEIGAARDAWSKAVADPKSVKPEDLPGLAQHLNQLPYNELWGEAKAIGQKAGGLKNEIVDRLLQHVGAKPAAQTPAPPGGTGTSSAPAASTVNAPQVTATPKQAAPAGGNMPATGTPAVDYGAHLQNYSPDEVKSTLDALKADGKLKEAKGKRYIELYHVTDSDNLAGINEKGLVPGTAPASGQTWKPEHSDYATYFHTDKETAERDIEQGGGGMGLVTVRFPIDYSQANRIIPDEDSSPDKKDGLKTLVEGGPVAIVGPINKNQISTWHPDEPAGATKPTAETKPPAAETKPAVAEARQPDSRHELAVKQALAEGKTVPPEVLKDYPHLAGKGGAGPAPATFPSKFHPG